MKKIFMLLLLPIFLISVVGCGSETTKKEEEKDNFVADKTISINDYEVYAKEGKLYLKDTNNDDDQKFSKIKNVKDIMSCVHQMDGTTMLVTLTTDGNIYITNYHERVISDDFEDAFDYLNDGMIKIDSDYEFSEISCEKNNGNNPNPNTVYAKTTDDNQVSINGVGDVIENTYEPKCSNNIENVYYSKNFDETIYDSVASYLKVQENLEGKIIVPGEFNSETNTYEEITKELTKEEIEVILLEMDEEVRSSSNGVGGAAFIGMILTYEKNSEDMEIVFYGSNVAVVSSNDGDFIKLLDSQLGDDYENLQGFCNYVINTGTTVNSIIEQLKVQAEG